MPSARSASSASSSRAGSTARAREAAARSRETARPPRPRHVPLRSAATRVRWERLGRIALLVVLVAVLAVYAEHAAAWLSARSQNARQQAIVRTLQQQHAALEARKRALESPTAILRRARQLGMTRPGEQPYAINGTSSH